MRMRRLIAVAGAMALLLPATATASSDHSPFPYEQDYTNPCTEETVHLVGQFQIWQHLRTDPTGALHVTSRVGIHVSGTTASGVRYVGFEIQTSAFNGVFISDVDPGPIPHRATTSTHNL